MVASHAKYLLTDVLKELDVDIAWIVQQTGLGHDSVRRAVMGGNVKTNYTVAEDIAKVLGMHIDEIEWPSGLTHLGRPAHTGKPITAAIEAIHEVCPVHNIELPLSKICDLCA